MAFPVVPVDPLGRRKMSMSGLHPTQANSQPEKKEGAESGNQDEHLAFSINLKLCV